MAHTESSSLPVRHRPLATSARLGADPTVILLRGKYDLTTMAALGEPLDRAMAQGDADLVIDLSEVQFMDATTIGVIIRARNHLRAESRSLVLRSPPPWARRVLDQCDLAGLVGPVPPAPNLTVADPDLLATRHATDVALRQGP